MIAAQLDDSLQITRCFALPFFSLPHQIFRPSKLKMPHFCSVWG